MPTYNEIGSTGLRQFMGFVEEAYHKDLRWPSVQPLYSRMRRSDPEISMIRFVFSALSRGVSIEVELPDDASEKDKAAGEFIESVFEDMDGGEDNFIDTLISNVPFFGWGMWEIVPGLRSPTWAPPGGDDWRSQYKDGKIGIRRLGWRDTSSFYRWVFSDNGKAIGMAQYVFPNPMVTLQLADCLHLTFGDSHNPEGLTPLESVWRLERIKYGLEIIQGIGFEHSAGYLDVKVDKALTTQDKTEVRGAAKAILTAQEGNYALWPQGVVGEVRDTPFAAAGVLLDTIKYFGILKLQAFNCQWMALSATTGAGSLAAMGDSSAMFMTTYNAMMEGFAGQINKQIIPKLREWNPSVFEGLTDMPEIKFSKIEKKISLSEIASIIGPLKAAMPLGDDDYKAIRALTGFLPENLPEVDDTPKPPTPPAAKDIPDDNPEDDSDTDPDDMEPAAAEAQLRARWASYLLRHPEMMRNV
jgi:hypothetical protein